MVSCQVKLIAEHDEKIDKAITTLHRKTENFLIQAQQNIGSSDWKYQNKREFYNDVKVDISAIQVRAKAFPKNEITIQQINLLLENIKTLETLHKEGNLSKPVIENIRISFNASFTAILKLEIAKKKGGNE